MLIRCLCVVYYLPSRGEGQVIDGISVVLRCDVAVPRDVINNRLVLTTVTERQLFCLCTGGEREQLIAQANAEHGLHKVRRGVDHLGVGVGVGGLLVWLFGCWVGVGAGVG